MRIAIGSDHAGFVLKEAVSNHLKILGHEVVRREGEDRPHPGRQRLGDDLRPHPLDALRDAVAQRVGVNFIQRHRALMVAIDGGSAPCMLLIGAPTRSAIHGLLMRLAGGAGSHRYGEPSPAHSA